MTDSSYNNTIFGHLFKLLLRCKCSVFSSTPEYEIFANKRFDFKLVDFRNKTTCNLYKCVHIIPFMCIAILLTRIL